VSKLLPRDDLDFIDQKLSGITNQFNNKHIFITGATGFIGSWLLESLIYIIEQQNLNLSISILTRNKKKFIENYPDLYKADSLQVIEGDIRNLTVDVVTKSIDYIIHAATDARYDIGPLLMADTIVSGTRNILDLACKHKVAKILFLSSGAVYGRHTSSYTEDSNFSPDCNNPLNSYGEAKRYAELLCAIYHKEFNVPYVSARCFAFIGPRLPLNIHFAIGNFISNILKNEEIIISGNGQTVRSYMYAADLVVWLFSMLINAKPTQVYNVGSNHGYTIEQIVKMIIASSRQTHQYKILNKDDKNDIYVPNIDKALDELSLNVFHDLKTSIVKTLDWHR